MAVGILRDAEALRPGQLAVKIVGRQVAVGEDRGHIAAVAGHRAGRIAGIVVELHRLAALGRGGHVALPEQLPALRLVAEDLPLILVRAREEDAAGHDHRRAIAGQRQRATSRRCSCRTVRPSRRARWCRARFPSRHGRGSKARRGPVLLPKWRRPWPGGVGLQRPVVAASRRRLTAVAPFPSAPAFSAACLHGGRAFRDRPRAATWPSGFSATVARSGRLKPAAVAASTTNSPATVHRAAGVQVASQSRWAATGSGCGCFRRKVAAHLAAANETMIPPHNSPAPESVKACCRKYSSRDSWSSLRISSLIDSLAGCCFSAAFSASAVARDLHVKGSFIERWKKS